MLSFFEATTVRKVSLDEQLAFLTSEGGEFEKMLMERYR